MKRILFCFLVILSLVTVPFGNAGCGLPFGSLGPVEVNAATIFPDTIGHWSRDYVIKAVNYGVISGYEDNTFRPDRSVTRAEFSRMINNGFGNSAMKEISFSDTYPSEWYYDDLCKGTRACYIKGYEDNTFRPSRTISRQEAAAIAYRLMPYSNDVISLYKFSDVAKVQDWAYEPLQRVLTGKYLYLRAPNMIHPEEALTRAEAVKLICDMLDRESIQKETETVVKSGVTLAKTTFTNDVIIDKAVAEGKVTLKNCVVLGNLIVRGGGVSSIYLENTRVSNLKVSKAESPVRIVASDTTVITETHVEKAAVLEEGKLSFAVSDAGFNDLTLEGSSMTTLVNASVPVVQFAGEGVSLTLKASRAEEIVVPKTAPNAYVSLDEESSVGKATVDTPMGFYGKGMITEMYASVDGITYEKRPVHLYVGPDVKVKPEKSDAAIVFTANPANNAVGVSPENTITLSLNRPIRNYDKKAVTSAILQNAINFNLKKENGTPVPFTAKINDDATVITIKPDDDLKKKTKYYISILEGEFIDENGNYNDAFKTMFTTGDGTVDGVSFKPANKSEGNKPAVKPVINFANSIIAYDGKSELSPTYLKRNIHLVKIDPTDDEKDYIDNGKTVYFTAEINKKHKGITITPKKPLEDGAVYYLGFDNKVFKYEESGDAIESQFILFTVGYVMPEITFEPKDGGQYFGNSKDILITSSVELFASDMSKLTSAYLKENISFMDDTTGQNVAFTADTYTKSKKFVIELDPVSLLPDGHQFTVSVPEGKLVDKNKKSIGKQSVSFTSGYTEPVINSVTAVGTTAKVTAKVTANMVGTGYIKVVPAGTTLTKADEVKSGGTTFTAAEGKAVEVSISGVSGVGTGSSGSGFTGGSSYKVYVCLETSSKKVSPLASTTVTITKDVAAGSRLVVTDNNGLGYSKSDSMSGGTSFNYTLPFGANSAKLAVTTAASGDTVAFEDVGSGSSGFTTSTDGSFVVTGITGSADRTVKIKVSGSNKTDSVYTVVLKVSGNTGATISVDGALGTLDGGSTFMLAAGTTSAVVNVNASDPNAAISCSALTPSSATGSLTGTVNLGSSTETLEITVQSNRDSKTYTIKLQRLE